MITLDKIIGFALIISIVAIHLCTVAYIWNKKDVEVNQLKREKIQIIHTVDSTFKANGIKPILTLN